MFINFTVIIFSVFLVIDNNLTNNNLLMLLIIHTTVLICISILFYMINNKKYTSSIENDFLVQNLTQEKELVDKLRMQKHDYMNHLQVILLQIDRGKINDAKNYISNICSNVEISKIFETKSPNLDPVLNLEYKRCDKLDIELTANVDFNLEELNFNLVELNSIFLNIIDNAIDELSKFDSDFKFIHVEIYEEENTCYIEIKNNGPKINDMKKIFKKGISSKGSGRGFGLFTIKEVINSYGGDIFVKSDEDETTFFINLPLKIQTSI